LDSTHEIKWQLLYTIDALSFSLLYVLVCS
jgi:hypothetical protein